MIKLVLIVLFMGLGGQVMYADEHPKSMELTLAQALERANAISVAVVVASARVQQAVALMSQARSSLLPQLTGTVAGARQTSDMRATGMELSGAQQHIGPYNNFDARVRITQSLFDAGAFERWRAARLGERLSESQMAKAKEDSLALVAFLYIQAQRAQQRENMDKVLLKRDSKALKVAETRFRQGIGSAVAVKQARADYAQSVYAYKAASSQAIEKRLDLAAALKIPLDVRITFKLETLDLALEGGDRNHVPADVQVAQDQLKTQQAQAVAARADFIPKVSAVGNYGRLGESPDHGSNTYMVGLQASVPIWEGSSKQANLGLAKARVKEARANLEDIQIQNEARILNAKENIVQAKTLLFAKKVKVKLVNKQMILAHNRLRLGMGNQLDVDNAIAQIAVVSDEYYEALAQIGAAKISLLHALGKMQTLIKSNSLPLVGRAESPDRSVGVREGE